MSVETQSSSDSQSSQSSDSQSSGGKRKPTVKAISFKLHSLKRTYDERVGLGLFNLEMPYDPDTSRFKKDSYPSLFLDVKDSDQIETLKIMRRLSHPNILGIALINQVKGEEGVRVYFEPYEGVLSKHLKKICLVNPKTNLIPSEPLQNIVSEVVDGLNFMRENDEYHGNFAWDTTYYSNDTSKIVTKLANLERKGSKSRREYQVADCVSLGLGLAEISEYAKQHHAASAATCCLIDDLSSRLISVKTETLDKVMDGIKDCVFFWNEKRRKTFFAIEVPGAWDRKAFEARFTQSEAMPALPWTDEPYDGYLSAMIAYRDRNGMEIFKKNYWKDFLRCITGMYTHQTELDVEQSIKPVDYCVQFAHPRLCLDLKAAMDLDQPPMVQSDRPAVDQPDEPPVDQPEQPLVPVA